jgi:putative ABC transport system permease protein
MTVPYIALRNLARQRRRYRLLGAAVAFCFFVILSIVAVLDTMVVNMEDKARIYYGGDFSIKGVSKGSLVIDDPRGVTQALREELGDEPIISERVVYRNTNSSLFFAGEGVRQRILNGADFGAERELFARFNYVDGGPDGMAGTNGILISEPVAKLLGARVGDDLLLLLNTLKGQRNTATVVVRGIFRDSSLFGYYTSYLDIDFLRSTILMPSDQCTDIGIFFRDGRPDGSMGARLQARLGRSFAMFPLVDNQQKVWDMAARENWQGVRLALLPLNASLEQVRQILEAVWAAAAALVAILLGVVVMGVTNTYRAIVFDRTREIGTMRALGMQRPAAAGIFFVEALSLAFIASGLGLAVAFGFLRLLSLADFSFIPAFDIFLRDGRISASISLRSAAAVFGVVGATAMLAAGGAAGRAASVEPAIALRSVR